jgi:hypothetical protein
MHKCDTGLKFEHKEIVCESMRLVAEAAVGVAESGHLIDAAVPPVVNVLAVPLVGVGAGARAGVGVAVGEAAVVASELDSVGRLVPPEFGALKGVRCVAVLDPVDEVVHNVVVRVRCGLALTEHPCTSARNATDTAVSHAGNAEVAHKVIHGAVVKTHLVSDLEVVTLGVGTGSERVSHAVVHQELATDVTEAGEVAAEGRGVAVALVKVERVAVVSLANGGHIEVGVVVNTAAVVVASDTLDVTGKLAKGEGIDLRTGQKSRVKELAIRVEKRSEDVLDGVDLSVGETPGVVLDVAVQGAGVEVADSRVLNNSIGDAIKSSVALQFDLGLNKNPLVLGQELSIAFGASQLDEAGAPALKVLEIGRSSTGDNAIEIARVVLSRVKTLSTTGRATDVVGLGGGRSVVLVNDLFSNLDRGVASTVSPIDDSLVVVQHP